ncbi:unnamed protein product [Owenia fusiformis]|uniref:Beta-lactamase-related domain-containing protein n=1 Tax=Owenia fusiformis TaxID=6347 RepID=A0A8S4Q360_OWEFU|nr:unnamed protein product [Owenia fusiformis]
MIMNLIALVLVIGSVTGQVMKEKVENELIPFEHFVGTDREGETKTLAERMQHWFVPGISVAVINNYQVEWADGYGEAQNGVPATADTIYQAGTISSFLSALTALKYVENGTLNLETNINDYLTSNWKMSYKKRRDNRVKLKHLLSHSGAVTVDEFDGYTRGQTLPTLQQTLSKSGPANNPKVELIEDLLDVIFNDPFTPGTQEDYSSGGFAALQQVLEDVTGQSFSTIVQQLVLDKAGMSSSSFAIRDYNDINGVAFGYHCNSSEESVIPGNWNTYPESAAQGLWTNVGDLAKLVINVAKGKSGDPGSILNTQSTNDMLTIQLKNGQGNPRATEDGTFGLGPEVVDGRASSKWFFNTGYNEGYCSEVIGNTDGRGLVMMSNLGCERSHFLLGELFRAVAAAYRWEDAESAKIDFNTRLPAKIPLESPQPWEGLYKVEPYDTGIPGVGVIQPFQSVYVSANTVQVDQAVCIVYMYPCANLDNVYCPTISIFQDVGDKLGQLTFTPDGASGYKGELYLGVVPIVDVEVKVSLTRISASTGTFPTETTPRTPSGNTRNTPPAGVSTTMSIAGSTTSPFTGSTACRFLSNSFIAVLCSYLAFVFISFNC